MRNEIPKLELELERFIKQLWRNVRDFGRYLTTKPKNRFELMDKHALMLEILSFISLFVALVIRIRG